MLFGGDEPEAGPLVDVAGGGKHAVGPQRDHAVARLAREAERFLDQPRADAEPTRARFDQKKAQPRDRVGFAHKEDRPDILAVSFGDPAALPLGIVMADKGRDDFRRQRFEPCVPAVFVGIKGAMSADDPTHVAARGGRRM